MTTRGSSGPSIEPDVVVRTALELLPIPPHDDEFWRQLEAALDAEPPHVAPVEPAHHLLVTGSAPSSEESDLDPAHVLEPDSSLAVVPAAFRRTSNAVLAALAAAAVVVVAIAGNTLMDERNGTAVNAPEADPELETLVRNAQDDGGTVTTLSSAREDASSEAVLAWVGDLGDGDADAAWDAMGEASQAHFASQSEFEGQMTELAEGYGAWSAAEPDEVLVTPVVSDDDGTVAVVTLLGTLEQESGPLARADAFPVRIADGDVVLEPFASAGELEVVIPEVASDDGLTWESVGAGEELVFVLPGDVDAPVLQIDGGDTVICGEAPGSEFGDLDQSDGQRCAYLPEGGFEAGPHTVTVAFLGSGGDAITAESIRFEAA